MSASSRRKQPSNGETYRLRGKIAIANAKLAYQSYKRLFAGPRWEKLKAKGARVQRAALGQHRREEPRPTAMSSMSRN